MKKSFVIASILGLFFVLAILGPLSTPQALAKSIELSLGTHPPPKASPVRGALLPWTKEVEKQTNGQVKIKIYPSQTLVKMRDAYDGVIRGIADISWGSFSLTPGRFPLISVMELPFLSPNTFVGAHTLHDLFKKFPEIRAELKDVHMLDLWVTLPYEIHTVKKPVRTMADLKGMKLATQPGARAALEALGAIPVTMGAPKIYQAVEKGIADGAVLAWGAFNAYKLYEVTKYHANAHLGGLPYFLVINKNSWAKLSKENQTVITKLTQKMWPDIVCGAVSKEMEIGIKKTKAKKNEIVDFSPEELKDWIATGKPEWNKWVKKMESKGLPGQAVLDEAVKLVEKYSKIYMK
jgi:TRAP-type transport system periplasmic protein